MIIFMLEVSTTITEAYTCVKNPISVTTKATLILQQPLLLKYYPLSLYDIVQIVFTCVAICLFMTVNYL